MRGMRIAAVAAALVIGTVADAGAQSPAQGGEQPRRERAEARQERGGHPRMRKALFRGIDLTADQRARIEAIHERYRPQAQAIRENRRRGERPDSATRQQARDLMQKRHAEVRAVLTPEQQRTFDANVAERRERGRAWREGRDGRHGSGHRGHADQGR